MIRKFTLSIVLLFTFIITKAQLPNGTVVENFTAADIYLQMNHTWVGDLAAYLVAPDQTVYTLLDRPGVPATTFGCSFNNLILTFSPSASSTAADLENTCNQGIAISGIFQPIDDYTAYSGPTEGNWTLVVNDAYDGDGGAIESWNMTVCEPVDVSENLIKINNELIQIPMGGQEPIPTNDLLYEATEGTAADVVYVLTSLPEKGDLLLNGTALAQWQNFTQSDINNGNLVYQNNGVDAGEDAFQFNAEKQESSRILNSMKSRRTRAVQNYPVSIYFYGMHPDWRRDFQPRGSQKVV